MEIWSMDPKHDNLTLMEFKESPWRNVIFWHVQSTYSDQIIGLHTSGWLMSKNKMDTLQAQLEKTYERYLRTKRGHEEKMKKKYVLDQRTIKLKMEIVDLKKSVRDITKIHDKDVWTKGQTHETGETSGHAIEIDEEKLEASKDAEIRAMNNLLIHKINALRAVS